MHNTLIYSHNKLYNVGFLLTKLKFACNFNYIYFTSKHKSDIHLKLTNEKYIHNITDISVYIQLIILILLYTMTYLQDITLNNAEIRRKLYLF